MESVIGLFPICPGEVVSIVGMGGKTTLLWELAHAFSFGKTLVTTTTKMSKNPSYGYDVLLTDAPAWKKYFPVKKSITLAGQTDPASGKFSSFPLPLLKELLPRFDYTLIEADGSKMRPLKGWAPFEPVIISETTMTIGVMTLWPLGMPANEKIIHRFPLFQQLTGIKEGEAVTLSHISAMVSHPQGLFREGKGKKMLFINQVDKAEDWKTAELFLKTLPSSFLDGLFKIGVGSLLQKTGMEWKKGFLCI